MVGNLGKASGDRGREENDGKMRGYEGRRKWWEITAKIVPSEARIVGNEGYGGKTKRDG